MDLDRSKYEIGGNGFHDGLFVSGSIEVVPEPAGRLADPAVGSGVKIGLTPGQEWSKFFCFRRVLQGDPMSSLMACWKGN